MKKSEQFYERAMEDESPGMAFELRPKEGRKDLHLGRALQRKNKTKTQPKQKQANKNPASKSESCWLEPGLRAGSMAGGPEECMASSCEPF